MSGSPTSPLSQIEWIAPTADLLDFAHTFFIMRADKGEHHDIMPAYSAQIFIFVEGTGTLHFPDREPGHSGDVTFNAPMLSAAPMTLDGPVINVGASLTALGWAALSRTPVTEMHDQSVEADAFLGPEVLAPLQRATAQARAGERSAQSLFPEIEAMIRAAINSPARKPWMEHKQLLDAIDAWLISAFNPPIDDLYNNVALGQRQIQRLCKRYYGVPPAQLVKRSRAIRAAMLLAHEDLSVDLRDDVLGAYYDQAHLIHDIRRFTGRTPKKLANEPLAQEMLDPKGHGRAGKTVRE
ncbi:MAG: helix-turn-helix domain-containing protein [Pseudomonadota bacterium]